MRSSDERGLNGESAQGDRLAALAGEVRRDLARIAHPSVPWLEPRMGPDGNPAFDVLIVGAGQSGLAIAFALKRAQVNNVLAIDKAERGLDGPWSSYARMRSLRSPKDYTGPDLDVPSLTYQAWHEARFGPASWGALELIPTELWASYLLWVRETTAVPVRNRCEALDIAPAVDDLIAVTVRTDGAGRETLYARKLVLATGQEGMGRWWMPNFVLALPSHRVGPGRCLALALHEHHTGSARGLSPGDLGSVRLPRELPSVHLRTRLGGTSTSRCGPSSIGSPPISPHGATATRRPTCVTTALPAFRTSAKTSNSSRSFPAPHPGSATSTSLPWPLP